MTDQDRVLLLGMVRAILNENAPIVITHGTDTMVERTVFRTSAAHATGPHPGIFVMIDGQSFPIDRVRPVDRVQKDHASCSFVCAESPGLWSAVLKMPFRNDRIVKRRISIF
jgi:L-asparaginase/Glu-tRNA(Gln) amidotransferase subunit D